MGESCATCCFWFRDTENRVRDFGYCQRAPPIMTNQRSSCATYTAAGWPESKPTDWCGEWVMLGNHPNRPSQPKDPRR